MFGNTEWERTSVLEREHKGWDLKARCVSAYRSRKPIERMTKSLPQTIDEWLVLSPPPLFFTEQNCKAAFLPHRTLVLLLLHQNALVLRHEATAFSLVFAMELKSVSFY